MDLRWAEESGFTKDTATEPQQEAAPPGTAEPRWRRHECVIHLYKVQKYTELTHDDDDGSQDHS